MSLTQGTVPPTTLSVAAQPSTSTTSSMGCIQFPPGTALGSQLASAALLGRTLPTAGTQPIPVKVALFFPCFYSFSNGNRKEKF